MVVSPCSRLMPLSSWDSHPLAMWFGGKAVGEATERC